MFNVPVWLLALFVAALAPWSAAALQGWFAARARDRARVIAARIPERMGPESSERDKRAKSPKT